MTGVLSCGKYFPVHNITAVMHYLTLNQNFFYSTSTTHVKEYSLISVYHYIIVINVVVHSYVAHYCLPL